MNSYTKLFSCLLTSTIWAEDDKTRIVWVTMLAMADQHGEVHSTVPGLSRLSGVPVADVEKALAKFMSPDQYSRTKDHEGRRIAEIEGGWELLNHAKYRALASREDSKAKATERQKRKRDRDMSRDVTPCHATSRENVTSHASVTQDLHIAEAEAEAEAEGEVSPKPPLASGDAKSEKRFAAPEAFECVEYGATIGLIEDECLHFHDHYEANGWMRNKTKMKCWKASMRTWKRTSQTFGRNGHQNQNPPAKPTFVRIKELNTRIDRHPANWESVKSRHHDPTWTPEQKEKDKAELRALRAELAALEEGREVTEQSDEP